MRVKYRIKSGGGKRIVDKAVAEVIFLNGFLILFKIQIIHKVLEFFKSALASNTIKTRAQTF